MRWQGGRESTNVEDRRGASGGGMRMGIGGGIGGIVLLVLVSLFTGADPGDLISSLDHRPRRRAQTRAHRPTMR